MRNVTIKPLEGIKLWDYKELVSDPSGHRLDDAAGTRSSTITNAC